MFIKSIKISGFKNVPETDHKHYDFYEFTKIKGENFQGKTSLGDALCWVFTGKSSTGISADYILRNETSKNASVELVFEDNSKKVHKIKREMQNQGNTVYLDDIPVKDAELQQFICNPEIFLSIFMIGYFNRLNAKTAKEVFMSVVPFPSHEVIVNKIGKDIREYVPSEVNFDANSFLKQKRSELKMLEDEIKRIQNNQILAQDKLKTMNVDEEIDVSNLKQKLESLEDRKVKLIKLSVKVDNETSYQDKLSIIRLETINLKGKKGTFANQQQTTCPSCKRPMPEEEIQKIMERADELEKNIQNRLDKLEIEEKEIIQKIEDEKAKRTDTKAIDEELIQLEKEIREKRQDYEKLILHNQAINSSKKIVEDSKLYLETSENQLKKLKEERYRINRGILAASDYNSIKSDLQYEVMRSSLKNVSIRLQRVNQTTNEIKDCFEVLYKGREFSQISTSEGIRVGLEISGFLNLRTGLKIPIFIDNAESITHYDMPTVQVFEAMVMKDAELTVERG